MGSAAQGIGTLLEDAFDIDAAVWAFFGGGLLMMVGLLVAGVAALTVRAPERWAGAFLLLAVPGGLLGFGIVMMGVSWILLGRWLPRRNHSYVVALYFAVVASVVIGAILYGSDVFGGG